MKNLVIVISLIFLCKILYCQTTITLFYDTNGNRLSKSFQGSSPNPVVVATPSAVSPNQACTLTASGCPGTVQWSTGQQGASISVTPATTTQYTAECITPNCANNGIGQATVEVYQCTPDAIGITSTLYTTRNGQTVTLTAYGCLGTVKWSNGQIGFTISPQVYGASSTFTATCSKRNCPNSGSGSVSIAGTAGCNSGDVLVTAQAGNWNATTTWVCGRIPTVTDEVYLNHEVQVNVNGFAKSITLGTGSLNYPNSSFITLSEN